MYNSSDTSVGVGCFEVLAIVFIVLKLTGVIAWSWIWVLAPLWAPILFIVIYVYGKQALRDLGKILEGTRPFDK